MGQKYLIDTNILIYALEGLFINNSEMTEIFNESFNTSIISEIEFLGWKGFSNQSKTDAKKFLDLACIHPLTSDVKNLAIELKQKHNSRLGDSIIAATSIVNNYILVSRNMKDFEKIDGLEIYNPFEIKKQ